MEGVKRQYTIVRQYVKEREEWMRAGRCMGVKEREDSRMEEGEEWCTGVKEREEWRRERNGVRGRREE